MRVVALLAAFAVALLLWPDGNDARARGMRPIGTPARAEVSVVPPAASREPSHGVRPRHESEKPGDDQAPPVHPLFLRVYNEHGEEVTKGSLTIERGTVRLGHFEDLCEAPVGARGIELGEFDANSTFRFEPEHASHVRVFIEGAPRGSHTFFGLTLSHRMLHDAVLLPNGTSARNAGATFSAWCKATTTEGAWSRLPVYVTVWLAGYEPLEFVYELDRTRPRFVMKAKLPE